jgi:hypothetical protein
MTAEVTWLELGVGGTRVGLLDGVPILIVVPTFYDGSVYVTDVDIDEVKLEIEVQTGWRVATSTISGAGDPRSWVMVADAVGKLATPIEHAEYRAAPTHWHGRQPNLPIGELVGVPAWSNVTQLTAEWRGQPRGMWVVYIAGSKERGGPAVGFVREVGMGRVLMALLDLPKGDARKAKVR